MFKMRKHVKEINYLPPPSVGVINRFGCNRVSQQNGSEVANHTVTRFQANQLNINVAKNIRKREF